MRPNLLPARFSARGKVGWTIASHRNDCIGSCGMQLSLEAPRAGGLPFERYRKHDSAVRGSCVKTADYRGRNLRPGCRSCRSASFQRRSAGAGVPILRPFIDWREAASERAKVRGLALIQARRHPLHRAVVGVFAQVELQRLHRRLIRDDSFAGRTRCSILK